MQYSTITFDTFMKLMTSQMIIIVSPEQIHLENDDVQVHIRI